MEFAKVKEEPENSNYDELISEEMLIPEIQIKQEEDILAANCEYDPYGDLKQLTKEYECEDTSYMEEHYDRLKDLCSSYNINNVDEPSCSKRNDLVPWRERFLSEILKSENEKSSHFNVLTKEKYSELIQQVEEAESAENKTPLQQRRLKRFAVLNVGSEKKLISRGDLNIRYYLPAEDLYDVINAAHVAVDHGGRDKMLAETSLKYANITREMIILYLSMCETCQQKKPKKKKNLVSKPILHSVTNSRCQVDLIDFQVQFDGKFKYVMVYQDYLTKFVLLRALESNKAAEVAYHLNDIFLTIGAPCILQSDSGRDFVNHVIHELARLWPELKIVHGKPRQTPGSIEHISQDIENMVYTWLKNKKSTKWSEALSYIQFMKNRAYHPGIKQSPYKAMFGIEPRIGLSSTSLPSELINDIHDEDDLPKINEDDLAKNKTNFNNSLGNNISIDDNEKQTADECFETQAKKMRTAPDQSYSPVIFEDNLNVPMSDVDRSSEDLGNDNSLYKTENGILQKLIYRNEFDVSGQHFLPERNTSRDFESLYNVTATKTFLIPSPVRCTCTKNCITNRCQCKKRMLLCNPKCHRRIACDNK